MVKVVISAEARQDLAGIPATIKGRFYDVLERLKDWPAVSGAKPLRRDLKGLFRIRTGD